MSLRLADFRTADFEQLTHLWNDLFPDRYHIDAELLEMKTVASPTFDWGASSVIYDGETAVAFAAVKRSSSRLYRVMDPDIAHLSSIAFKQPKDALTAVAHAKGVLKLRGVHRLVFGQDSGHFFPGCPEDCKFLHAFLTVEAFDEGGLAYDLERDLSDYSNPAKPVNATFGALRGSQIAALQEFLTREFPGRWTYDVLEKQAIEGPEKSIFVMWIDGQVEGFALLQDWTCQVPVGGAVWRKDLGEQWGSLGPIGVSSNLRGKGFGDALLGAALENLKSRGVRRCIIDWTGLAKFYGRHGFEISRSYRSMYLKLDDLVR